MNTSYLFFPSNKNDLLVFSSLPLFFHCIGGKRKIGDQICANSPSVFANFAMSRAEQEEEAAVGAHPSGQRKATHHDALVYINDVKERFGEGEKFREFLAVMQEFKSARVKAEDVVAQVCEIFNGHRDLILGFNKFLPENIRIKVDSIEPPGVGIGQALHFVHKIKNRFGSEDHIYKEFLSVLYLYKKHAKTVKQVYHEVAILFRDHPNLLVEFRDFLPRESESAVAQVVPPHKFSSCDGPGSNMTDMNHISSVKRNKSYRLYPGRNLHIDQHDPEREGQRMHIERENNWKEDRARSHHKLDEKGLEHHCKDPHGEQHRRKPSSTFVEQPLQGMEGLCTQQYKFCAKVKERLQSVAYKDFLRCLNMHSQGIISRKKLKKLVHGILKDHSDLMDDFNEVLALCDSIEPMEKPIRLDDREKSKERYNNEQERDCPTEGDQDDQLVKDDSWKATSLCRNEDLCKPISELELSDCERCTPSYCHLPKDYPARPASCRGELEAEVLNDVWVSVTSGSEDYSFRRKNQYEESLFRCEDDRFELDMLLESVQATIERVKELLEKVQEHSVHQGGSIHIEDHLTSLHWRCIERLYGDHGLDVAEVLRKNASQALPVILTRLKQKHKEWSRCRADFNQVWAEIYAKNYHRSLDHRSFNFKQNDEKRLSKRALLAEIKEISENQQKNNEVLTIHAENKGPVVPHMEFEYIDAAIHQDLYRIIKFSCGEVCTSQEQFEEIMTVWTTFLEPMLGVQPRSHNAEDTEDAVEPKGRHYKRGSMVVEGENNGTKRANVAIDDYTNEDNKGCLFNEMPDSDNIYKVEREEGELSPNEYFEDNSSAALHNGTSCMPKLKGSPVGKQYKSRPRQVEFSPEGEECAKSPSGDSGPASSASESPLSTEAGDGEEYSHEDREEEELADQSARAKSDGSAEGTAYANNANQEIKFSPYLEHLLRTVKPLAKYVPATLHQEEDKCSRTFYGNASFYILFRLHQILYERLYSAKINSLASDKKCGGSKDNNPQDLYAKFISGLFDLLDGSADSTTFEDNCRATVGTKSYVLFTLDKLVYKVVKQLQAIVSDDMDKMLIQLYSYEKLRRPGEFCDLIYHENACSLRGDENLYQFRFCSSPLRLSILLMEEFPKSEVTALPIDTKFSSYLYNDFLSGLDERTRTNGVFLARNKRKYGNDDDDSATFKALDIIQVFNGLECKMYCSSSKVSYVIDTEDFLYRARKKRRIAFGSTRPLNSLA